MFNEIKPRKDSFSRQRLKDLETRIAICGEAMSEAERDYQLATERLENNPAHFIRNHADVHYTRTAYETLSREYDSLQHELEEMF